MKYSISANVYPLNPETWTVKCVFNALFENLTRSNQDNKHTYET